MLNPTRTENPLVFMVHGYDHDPQDPKNSPEAEGGVFPLWRGMLPGYATYPLSWYSGLFFRDAFKAWLRGYRSTYTWAYGDLSLKAANQLLSDAKTRSAPRYCIAHSLGSRVVLQSIKHELALSGHKLFDKVLLLNGAETSAVAYPIIREAAEHGTEFLNVCVKEDDVLDKCAGYFSPRLFGKEHILGQDGIPDDLPNVRQVTLDDERDQLKYRQLYGWNLQGDNPGSYGDHWHSYRHEDNHPLYRAFFAGIL